MSGPSQQGAVVADEHGRQPFEHPALSKVDNFNVQHPSDVLSREKVERLALDVGLDKVLRWKPRLVRQRPFFPFLQTSCFKSVFN